MTSFWETFPKQGMQVIQMNTGCLSSMAEDGREEIPENIEDPLNNNKCVIRVQKWLPKKQRLQKNFISLMNLMKESLTFLFRRKQVQH